MAHPSHPGRITVDEGLAPSSFPNPEGLAPSLSPETRIMARHRTASAYRPEPDERFAVLLHRARKLHGRGEARKALAALREACLLDEHCAWVWTLQGAWLARLGRADEAIKLYRHALWLRRSAGDAPRVRSTQHLIDLLGPTRAAA